MFFKKSILSAVVFMALFSSASYAAVESSVGGWTISPIGADNNSAYCSMKNVFANGHSLVFARNAKESNSIAIDFGSPALQQGQQYNVDLDVGAQASRTATGFAATQNVLLVNMGYDEQFYKALARQNALYVTLGQQQYSYSLKGTSDGLTELQECTTGLYNHTPRMVESITPPSFLREDRSVAVLQPKEQKVKVKKDTADIEKLRAANASLQEENARMKRETAAMHDRKMKEQGAEQDLRAVNSALLEENARMRREVAAMREAAQEEIAVKRKQAMTEQAQASNNPVVYQPAPNRSVNVAAPLEEGHSSSNPVAARQWTTQQGVFGQAQSVTYPSGIKFSDLVQDYFDAVSEKCDGDFAYNAKQNPEIMPSGVTVQTAEMACIGGVQEAAGALLFMESGDVFTVVTHETSPQDVSLALSERDAFYQDIRGQSLN